MSTTDPQDLIEQSSLGTPDARRQRARTPSDVVDRILDRSRELLAVTNEEPARTPELRAPEGPTPQRARLLNVVVNNDPRPVHIVGSRVDSLDSRVRSVRRRRALVESLLSGKEPPLDIYFGEKVGEDGVHEATTDRFLIKEVQDWLAAHKEGPSGMYQRARPVLPGCWALRSGIDQERVEEFHDASLAALLIGSSLRIKNFEASAIITSPGVAVAVWRSHPLSSCSFWEQPMPSDEEMHFHVSDASRWAALAISAVVGGSQGTGLRCSAAADDIAQDFEMLTQDIFAMWTRSKIVDVRRGSLWSHLLSPTRWRWAALLRALARRQAAPVDDRGGDAARPTFSGQQVWVELALATAAADRWARARTAPELVPAELHPSAVVLPDPS